MSKKTWWHLPIKIILLAIPVYVFVKLFLQPHEYHRKILNLQNTTIKKISDTNTPEIVLKTADVYLFGNEKVKNCRIEAEESNIFHNTKKTECKNVRCTLTTHKNYHAVLDAPKAYIDHNAKKISFPGSVTGRLENEKNSNSHQVIVSANKSVVNLENETIFLESEVKTIFKKIHIDKT